jgi:phage terminase large subunit GpA-like protein
LELWNPRTGNYRRAGDIFSDVAARLFTPPERLKVSEAAERYRILNNTGAHVGPWTNLKTPYLVEPMDSLRSRTLSGVVFAGPAQAGKTELILNWLGYSIVADPMDMLLFTPTQASSRSFSNLRVTRMLIESPAYKERLRSGRRFDNVFDKHFTNGMMLMLSWPSVTELAGRPVPRCALTDYDRMNQDVGDDGTPFDLAMKRNTTFGSFGMTLAESSPSYPILDAAWKAPNQHIAPPTEGIMGLYNRGDRRRWYWPCPHCGEHFIGRWENVRWDAKETNSAKAGETACMECPVNGCVIEPSERDEMNFWGRWVAEGQTIDEKGRVTGDARRSAIASYWLDGVAAAFTTWPKLVQKYLDAEAEFDRTGNEDPLKTFFNTDIGVPYVPRALSGARLPETLQARAEPWVDREVPPGVRFLVATVDIQGRSFIVQVHGIAPGRPFDICVIDRFKIVKSRRTDERGDLLPVNPGAYAEDWDLLRTEVMDMTYPLMEDTTRRMKIKLTLSDSGGEEGVTTMAYEFQRRLRASGDAGRFHLVKGVGNPNVPRTYIDFPDNKKKDRHAAARGDVPVLYMNSNLIKDNLSHRLETTTPGTGAIRFPSWLPDWWFKELCVEIRDPKGWKAPRGMRNEAWDLLYYCIGGCISTLLKVEQIDWTKPPIWAAEGETNPLVVGQEKNVAPAQKSDYDLTRLGQMLA